MFVITKLSEINPNTPEGRLCFALLAQVNGTINARSLPGGHLIPATSEQSIAQAYPFLKEMFGEHPDPSR